MQEKMTLICFKDNNKPANLVGHSTLRSIDMYYFFKITQTFDEKQANITWKTEEDKNTAKTPIYDADTNEEDNERIHKDKRKLVTMEEKRNTLE